MFNPFSKTPSLSPTEVALRLKNNTTAVLVDVRSALEYESGHAQGAKNIPLTVLENHTQELSTHDEVYVICQSGGRSSQAVQFLTSHGVHAINVSGGTVAWQNAGLPIE